MIDVDKAQLLVALRARLEETLDSVQESQRASQAGATHEEARPEHAKDTRSTEASYLARGLAGRVEALREQLAALDLVELRRFAPDDPVALTAIVEITDAEGVSLLVWLIPAGGGEKLTLGGRPLRCATPISPLGRSLLGRVVGDELSLDLPGGRRVAELTAIG